MNTGELIRKYRIQKGMNTMQLAEKTGISLQVLRQYEIGFRNPKINRVRTIADALEIPYPWLLGMEGDEYRKRMLADFTTEEILAEMKRRIESNCAKKTRKQEDKKRDLTR